MGFLDSLYDPTQYGSRFAPAPPDPTPDDVGSPAYTPTHAALSALLGFQAQRPSYMTRLGLAGGNPFGESIVNERGPEHRGANTVRQLLRGLLAGINTQALGQGKDYASKLAALEAGAKDENAANVAGSLAGYRQATLGLRGRAQDTRDATAQSQIGFRNWLMPFDEGKQANVERHQGVTEGFAGRRVGQGDARLDIEGRNADTASGSLSERTRHDKAMENKPTGGHGGGSRGGGARPGSSPADKANLAKVNKAYAAVMAAKNAKPTGKVKQAQIDANYRAAAANYNAVKRNFDAMYGGSATGPAPVHTTDSILKDLNAP